MLRLRIMTAALLLLVLIPALWAPVSWPLIGLVTLFVVAGFWEWGRLNALPTGWSVGVAMALGGVLVSIDAWTSWRWPLWAWWLAALSWVVAGALLLRRGVSGWSRVPRSARLAGGYAALVVVWWAVVEQRRLGVNTLLSSMALVWVADVFAYFGGKAWGRRKLAPGISPGKSWAGVYTGAVGVLVVATLWMAVDHYASFQSLSLYTLLWNRYGWGAPMLLLMLSAMSVVGDLVESLVKRSAGMKDSSQLLPGHGGVLDRVDALLPVMPMAVALTI